MGFRTNVKASRADEGAHRALTEGHTVYVHKVGFNAQARATGGASVGGVAEAIEAIEAAGWRLDHVTATDATVIMVFRVSSRAASAPASAT
jgi:hypothetical protein